LYYQKIKKKLPSLLERPLPGDKAHQVLSPLNRKNTADYSQYFAKAKKASVLVILENYQQEAHLIVTLRRAYPGVHSGQISFPGGKQEPKDPSLKDTALRETLEEIGVAGTQLQVKGALSPIYIPPSNYYVSPFLAFADEELTLIPEEKEVERIYRLPLLELLKPQTLQTKTIAYENGYTLKAPAFVLPEVDIWGATAMVLNEMLSLVRKLEP
jgi:8-oxo-dGTP pyrophosphatase MutT (NUDIX family)